MKVSVIIPNYNGKKLLEENLPVIFKTLRYCQIIVVDDCSTDGSAEFIKCDYPEVLLIENTENMGFSSSVNRGVKNAIFDLVLLLNSDVRPELGILDNLHTHFKDPKVFAVGCLEKSPEGNKIVDRGRGIGKFSKGFLIHSKGDNNKNNTLWVSGGSGLFNKKIWDKLGGFYEVYKPFYWEDIDLSYRALKSGYKIIFESRSAVYHNHLKGAIKSHHDQNQVNSASYKNQFIFVWLNITDLKYVINHFIYIPYHLFKSLITGNFAFITGFLSAIGQFSTVLKIRRKNRKYWVKCDSDVLSDFNGLK
jgi:GT2 family glycosyltransferase